MQQSISDRQYPHTLLLLCSWDIWSKFSCLRLICRQVSNFGVFHLVSFPPHFLSWTHFHLVTTPLYLFVFICLHESVQMLHDWLFALTLTGQTFPAIVAHKYLITRGFVLAHTYQTIWMPVRSFVLACRCLQWCSMHHFRRYYKAKHSLEKFLIHS